MSKPIVVVIHGMGVHTADSFKKEVTDPLDTVCSQFTKLKNKKFSEYFEVVSIDYDHIWNKIRKALAENAGSIEARLANISGVSQIAAVTAKLTSIEAKFNSDEFLYTHVLDVILYRTFYGEQTRVHVARKLLDAIRKANAIQKPIHVIAHSLGTAVMHDVLHKLYENDYTDATPSDLGLPYDNLSPTESGIDSLYQVANVSRVVDATQDAHDSAVRPGAAHLCRQMVNIHHEFDPFTLVKPFHRSREDNWISGEDWDSGIYRDIEFNDVTQLNVHDIGHYLAHPDVYEDLLATIYQMFEIGSQEELETARDAYHDTTAEGLFDKVKQAKDSLDWSQPDSIEAFWEALVKFYKFLKSLGGGSDDQDSGDES